VVRGQGRVQRRGDLRHVELGSRQGQRPRGRQLEERPAVLVAPLEVADPDGAVDRGPADRPVALGDDLPRAPPQGPLAVDAEEVELRALDLVEDPGVALGGADPADHRRGGVRGPVDRALRLLHQRARAACDERVGVVQGLG
jgi:hypothetical protein